jgi:hypothetical protein
MIMFSYERGSFCEWVPTGYVKGPFMMELSVMFSIREGLAYWTDYRWHISSTVSKTKVHLVFSNAPKEH